MRKRVLLPYAVIIMLLNLAPCHASEAVGGGSVPGEGNAASQTVQQREFALRAQLNGIETRLAGEREELAKLRHRWVVTKGRTPTKQEIQEFEKKLAKGEAKPTENPYYNKSPLTTPAPARIAYLKKLEEVRQDEALAGRLKEELAALGIPER